jgi:hypothetical protein
MARRRTACAARFPRIRQSVAHKRGGELSERANHLAAPASLLALCINGSRSIKNIDSPWLHPDLLSFTTQLQSELEHARRFSIASFGAALLYNLSLAEQAIGAGLPIAQSQVDQTSE